MSNSQQNPMTVAEPQQPTVTLPATSPEQVSFLSVISQVLQRENPNLDALDRAIALAQRLENERKEAEANAAFAAMWPKLPQVAKKGVANMKEKGSYKYVEDADLMDAVKPIMDTFGFGVSFTFLDQDDKTGRLTVEGELIYRANGYVLKRARLSSLPDAGPGRNSLQALGSAQTYLQKYIFRALLAVVQRGDDDDGKAAGGGGYSYTPHPKPPPKQPSTDTDWLAKAKTAIHKELASNIDRWVSLTVAATERAPSMDELLALERWAKPDIEHKDTRPADRSRMESAFVIAKARLTPFEAILLDAYGEPATGEVHGSPVGFAAEFVELWDATAASDRTEMLVHNADAIAAARVDTAAARMLDDATQQTNDEQKAPETSTTRAPVESPKEERATPPGEDDEDTTWAKRAMITLKHPKLTADTRKLLFDQATPVMGRLAVTNPSMMSQLDAAFKAAEQRAKA